MKLQNNKSDLSGCERTINISHYVIKTDLLGPYNRFALWVQGCCFRCEGCLAENIHDMNGGKAFDVFKFADYITEVSECEGISVSGGEPFLQAPSLNNLIIRIKEKRRDFGVIIYSGFTYQELAEKKAKDNNINELLSNTDILIDGRYEKKLDNGEFARGSSNQNIILLSDRYIDIASDYYNQRSRKAEILFYKNKSILTGVPSYSVLETWNKILKMR